MDPVPAAHMIGALKDQINATPPLYWALVWLWCKVFGGAVAVAAGCFPAWRLLPLTAGLYGDAVQAVGRVCGPVRSHLRPVPVCAPHGAIQRGPFLRPAVSAVYACAGGSASRLSATDRPANAAALVLNALLHGALTLTHVYGFLIQRSIWLWSLLLQDIKSPADRFCPGIFPCSRAGCCSCRGYPPFRNQAAIGKPWSWIVSPEPVSKTFQRVCRLLIRFRDDGFVLCVQPLSLLLLTMLRAQARAALSSCSPRLNTGRVAVRTADVCTRVRRTFDVLDLCGSA